MNGDKNTFQASGDDKLETKAMQNAHIDDFRIEYDFNSLKGRIAAARNKRERVEKIRFANEYIGRCVGRFRKSQAAAPKNAIANFFKSTAAFVQSDEARIAFAGLILMCSIFWIGDELYLNYAEQQQSEFIQKCSENNFKHLGNHICYDEYRHIQTINPDGSARKGAMDWNVWRETGFADRVAKIKKAD